MLPTSELPKLHNDFVLLELLEDDSSEDLFIFKAQYRNTCKLCSTFNNTYFTMADAENAFPYLIQLFGTWLPRVHPNCECELQPVPTEAYELYLVNRVFEKWLMKPALSVAPTAMTQWSKE